jgi:hypothetical protein
MSTFLSVLSRSQQKVKGFFPVFGVPSEDKPPLLPKPAELPPPSLFPIALRLFIVSPSTVFLYLFYVHTCPSHRLDRCASAGHYSMIPVPEQGGKTSVHCGKTML